MFNGRMDGIDVHTAFARICRSLCGCEAIKRAIANLVDNAAERMQNSLAAGIQIQLRWWPADAVNHGGGYRPRGG